jgi:23S rRNA (guanosine2251-2'-O)-methyltransferase
VLAAARARRVSRAFVARGVDPDPRLDELRTLVQLEVVERSRLDRLAGGGVHQGVVAELLPRRFLSLRELLERTPTLLVALDGVQDPQNLGAILRTAEACGAEGAILPERRGAPLGPAAIKASSGATELLPLCRVSGLASALPEVRRAGLWCVALDPRGEHAAWDFDLRQPVCLVVGGEGAGLHRLVRERCDLGLRIPLRGRVESLNASAAAAALLYEVVRQRAAGESRPPAPGSA